MKDKIEQILLSAGFETEQIGEVDFIRMELLDSIMIAEIIIGIEDGFGIEIDAEDIIPDNFRNVNTIINLVSRYTE